MTGRSARRVLAIDLASRGFGFVVLEGSDRLVDWGTRDIRNEKRSGTVRKVREIIEMYAPDVVILEDCGAPESRRRSRIGNLAGAVASVINKMGIRVRIISAARVRRTSALAGTATKHEIATRLAERYSELVPMLPRKRKAWESEDARGRVFGALAMAISVANPHLHETSTSGLRPSELQ